MVPSADPNTFECFVMRDGKPVHFVAQLTDPAGSAALFDSDAIVRACAHIATHDAIHHAIDDGVITPG